MCELLALSTSQPARLTFSLHTLAARGGEGSTTRDGWGVAFYQGDDVALFREPLAAADSELVRFLESNGPSTNLAISHIRHATRGTVNFANTQPFMRELGGRAHVFAHNGDLPGMEDHGPLTVGAYHPIGQTDSERAFCVLLARISALWVGIGPPPLEERMSLLSDFAGDLRALGPANFLYADGDVLFAHGHRRMHKGASRAEPPGLWTLKRHCAAGDSAPQQQGGISVARAEQTALLITSVPLTDEDWRPLAEGELLAVRNGAVIDSRNPGGD